MDIPQTEVFSDLKRLENVLQAGEDVESFCSLLEDKHSVTARWIRQANIVQNGDNLEIDQLGQALVPDDISQSSDRFIAYKSYNQLGQAFDLRQS